ncbi:MAG: hypothetical protein JNN28_19855 [Saprospiraceae bacterium]|nr:hypothetical protein [Saprospiraceae bacterium]
MQQSQSMSEALRNLEAKGYHLADTHTDHPEESAQPNDWRLDSVQKVHEEGKNALLIAVSSASRRLKLVFLESTFSPSDFSPLTLLRKLFPNKSK